ncbi:MAG: cation diffusion facilitator family transporter [Defluviitaleaceae bacterium]|nr:cation diffusion facilitator family transporter [Defluviitaleaceae bacterium]
MIDFLSKKFVKNHDQYEDPKVRSVYGILCSVVGIVLNLIMAIFKLLFGMIGGSMTLLADGFNNLSDVASHLATLFGFIFSIKSRDKEHPFGHGRLEYLMGLLISVLILFVGLQLLWGAIHQIFSPEPIFFSWSAIVVLGFSILLKYGMGKLNMTIGTKINSSALMAAGRDSKIDMLSTLVTLISLIASLYTTWPIDGIFAIFLSVIIIKTGYDIAKETITSLLGAPPDETLLVELADFVLTYERILGTHDLMIHEYGPGKKYLTLHVEVNKNEEMMAIHDVIDQIERDIDETFNMKATIHLDPVDLDDALTYEMKKFISIMVKAINPAYSIHDFRIRQSSQAFLLIFDLMIPAADGTPHAELKLRIDDLVKAYNPQCETLIEIDHSYS